MKRSLENLNIALVHEWITNVAGAEKVLLAMKEIFPKAPIYTAVYDEKKAPVFKNFEIHTSFLQNIPLMKKKRELLVPLVPFAFEQFDLSKFDLVISSTTMGAKGVITKPGTIHVSYCHTPPRYLWEPQTDPRAKKGRFGWLRASISHKMRIWDRLAADRVDYFLANSKYIANRIKKYYKRESQVIYPPVDIDCFKPVADENVGNYYLFVSRLIDYKRCDLVIDAFNQLGLPLKVIGYGPDERKLKSMARKNIEFLGPKFSAELNQYYSKAKAFVFAAEEDFGIVPVEAMAAGRPVVAYGIGGTSESVINGETGVLFYEQTVESLCRAIVESEKISFDSKKIRRHAERFSADRFKKELTETLEHIVENHT